MAKGKRLTELEKFQKAVSEIDFTKISTEELNATIDAAIKTSKRVELQKRIDELQKQMEEL